MLDHRSEDRRIPDRNARREFYETDYLRLNPPSIEDIEQKVGEIAQVLADLGVVRSMADIGCGRGDALAKLAVLLGAQITIGLDLSFAALQEAKQRILGISLVQGDAERLPFRDHSFDLCTCIDVLEHLPKPEVALAEQRRVAKHLLIRVPLQRNLLRCLVGMASRTIGERPGKLYGHLHFFTAAGFFSLLQRSGFRLKRHIVFPLTSVLLTDRRTRTIQAANRLSYKYLGPLYPWLWGGSLVVTAESSSGSLGNDHEI